MQPRSATQAALRKQDRTKAMKTRTYHKHEIVFIRKGPTDDGAFMIDAILSTALFEQNGFDEVVESSIGGRSQGLSVVGPKDQTTL